MVTALLKPPSKTALMDLITLGTVTVSNNPGMRQVWMLGVPMGQISVFGQGWGYNIRGTDYFFPTKELAAQARCRRIFTHKEYNFLPKLYQAWDLLSEEAQKDLLAKRQELLQKKKELAHV